MTMGSENWTLTVFRDAADLVCGAVLSKPDTSITFPTGSTPLPMFDVLAARAARGEVDFSGVAVFCLDEYVGVTVEDPNSLSRWLWDALLNRIGVTLSGPLPSSKWQSPLAVVSTSRSSVSVRMVTLDTTSQDRAWTPAPESSP